MGQNPHHYNYYLAHCPQGVTLTPSYNRVVYPQLYDYTDLHTFGNNAWMKFEFVIHPGGDPEAILMTFEGAEDVQLVEQTGTLVVSSSLGTYVFTRPKALRITEGGGTTDLSWQPQWGLSLSGDTVRFTDIGEYDGEEVLVLRLGEELAAEPRHVNDNHEWQTIFGGNWEDEAMDVKTDADGNAVFAGYTRSQFHTFPETYGLEVMQNQNAGASDAFIAKFQAPEYTMMDGNKGDGLMWATYFGGTGDDRANGVLAKGGHEAGFISSVRLKLSFVL